MPPTLLSIQVGRVQTLGSDAASDPHDRTWTTGFFKAPVAGKVHLGPAGLAGDEQADREHHGGADKAVLAYAAAHYDLWRTELGEPNMSFSGFGENLTVLDLDETNVCLGDVWSVGETLLEITQPRIPCWKLARRWRRTDLAALVIENGRTGWYLRVLTPGSIAAGDPLKLVERKHPEWTIARAHQVMHHHKRDRDQTAALASVPELATAWKQTLEKRLAALKVAGG
jgi:MOSC domain-containing protein YiiM